MGCKRLMANEGNEENLCICLDVGSGEVKMGVSGDDAPRVTFPCIVGKPRLPTLMRGASPPQDTYVGEEAEENAAILTLEYPMKHGIVQNWEDMEKIWHTLFYDSKFPIDPSKYNILLTEAPMNPKANRERMVTTMLSKFNFKGAYVAIQAVCAMYSTGKDTGVVLDSGDGVSHTVPVYMGYGIPNSINRVDLGGRDLTNYMMKLVSDHGPALHGSVGRETARKVKENLCYLAVDYEQELMRAQDNERDFLEEFVMPDGSKLSVGSERFRCPEALFQPSLLGKDLPGIHELVFNSISECQPGIRAKLYNAIVVSGGSTMFKNIGPKLMAELAKLAPQVNDIIVQAEPGRKYAVFIGSAIMADSVGDKWITRDELRESGASIVHKKNP